MLVECVVELGLLCCLQHNVFRKVTPAGYKSGYYCGLCSAIFALTFDVKI